jgi:hypothetical protein
LESGSSQSESGKCYPLEKLNGTVEVQSGLLKKFKRSILKNSKILFLQNGKTYSGETGPLNVEI